MAAYPQPGDPVLYPVYEIWDDDEEEQESYSADSASSTASSTASSADSSADSSAVDSSCAKPSSATSSSSSPRWKSASASASNMVGDRETWLTLESTYSTSVPEDIVLEDVAEDFRVIKRNTRWVERAEKVFMLVGMDRSEKGLMPTISRCLVVVLAIVLVGFAGLGFSNIRNGSDNATMLVVFSTWVLFSVAQMLIFSFLMPPRWFRTLVVSMIAFRPEDGDLQREKGLVEKEEGEKRWHASGDLVSAPTTLLFDRVLKFVIPIAFVAIFINSSFSITLWLDFGAATDLFRGLFSPWEDNQAARVAALLLNISANVYWILPLIPTMLAMYVLVIQFRHLSDHIRRGVVTTPKHISVAHKIIHRRSLYVSRFLRFPLASALVAHIVLTAFISYQMVVEDNDSAQLVVIQSVWLVSAAAIVFGISSLAALVHSAGKEGIVQAIADLPVMQEKDQSRLSFALSSVDRRQAGIRVMGVYLVTWVLIAKVVSLFATFLALLFNIRQGTA